MTHMISDRHSDKYTVQPLLVPPLDYLKADRTFSEYLRIQAVIPSCPVYDAL